MPAPRIDFSTPRGRLQYARDQSGYDQEKFGPLVGYPYRTWQKIEQGAQQLRVEHLVAANRVLRLDWRYYFGDISYEEARREGEVKNYNDLVSASMQQTNEIALLRQEISQKVRPSKSLDEDAHAVTVKPLLRTVVAFIKSWPDDLLDELHQMAIALARGVALGEQRRTMEKEAHPEPSGRPRLIAIPANQKRAGPRLGEAAPSDALPETAAGGASQ